MMSLMMSDCLIDGSDVSEPEQQCGVCSDSLRAEEVQTHIIHFAISFMIQEAVLKT